MYGCSCRTVAHGKKFSKIFLESYSSAASMAGMAQTIIIDSLLYHGDSKPWFAMMC